MMKFQKWSQRTRIRSWGFCWSRGGSVWRIFFGQITLGSRVVWYGKSLSRRKSRRTDKRKRKKEMLDSLLRSFWSDWSQVCQKFLYLSRETEQNIEGKTQTRNSIPLPFQGKETTRSEERVRKKKTKEKQESRTESRRRIQTWLKHCSDSLPRFFVLCSCSLLLFSPLLCLLNVWYASPDVNVITHCDFSLSPCITLFLPRPSLLLLQETD